MGRYDVMDFGKKISIKLCQIQKRTERMRILTFERLEGRYGKIVVFDHDKRDNILFHHAPKEMRAKAEEFFKTACIK